MLAFFSGALGESTRKGDLAGQLLLSIFAPIKL